MKLLLAIAVLLAIIFQANAASYSATIASAFQGCAGAAGGPTYVPTQQSQCTFSASGNAVVRWGVPYQNGGQQSGLRFEPQPGTVTLDTNSDSYIGKLTHLNFKLSDATNDANSGKTEIPSVVDLRLQVTISLPSGPQAFTPGFPLQVTETLNQAFQLVNGNCQQASGNPDWQLPDQGINGWNSGLPCCPYGSVSPCSDKIVFNALTDITSTFDDGATRYTLTLTGFKDIQSPSGNAVNKFISQEERASAAYLYARLSVKCTGDASCAIPSNDASRQCKLGSCNTGQGICAFKTDPAKDNNRCPIPQNLAHPQCQEDKCVSGSCQIVSLGNTGATCTTSNGFQPVDSCARMQCNSNGICVTNDGATSPVCWDRNATVNSNVCTTQRCTLKVCTTTYTSGACTPSVAIDTACSRGSCGPKPDSNNLLGTCNVLPTSANRNGQDVTTCTSPAPATCKWVQCEPTSGFTFGSCTYSNINSGVTCGTAPADDCQTRKCDGSGNCNLSNKPVNTTCTAAGSPTECKVRLCNSAGTCKYVNVGTEDACTGIPAPSSNFCVKRECKKWAGTCTYSLTNTTGLGSCSAAGKSSCKVRTCYGTSTTGQPSWQKCGYTNKPNNSSCGSAADRPPSHPCYTRSCQNGKCFKSPNLAYTLGGSGSCVTTPTLGTAAGSSAVSSQQCRQRNCVVNATSAVCVPLSDTGKNGNTCSAGAAPECTQNQCLNGDCGARNVNFGSCTTQTAPVPFPNDCIKRQCGSAGGVAAGQCGLALQSGSCASHWSSEFGNGTSLGYSRGCVNLVCATNGTCLLQLKTNGVSCGSTACTTSTCQNGVCVTTNLADGVQPSCSIASGVPSCRRAECRSGVCTANIVYNIGGPCTEVTGDVCNDRRCDATGACMKYFTGNTNTACGQNGQNQGCIVARCANTTTAGPTLGQGTCVVQSSSINGQSCGNPQSNACWVRQCFNGQCVRRADPTRLDQTCDPVYHCGRKRQELEEEAVHVMNARDLNPPINVSSDCQQKAAVDAGCYAYRCGAYGNCMSIPLNVGRGCGPTPPSAIQEATGFACAQYVCSSSGTCNTTTAAIVPILEGDFCSGFEPCPPTSPGCDSECQAFRCRSGTCIFDTREGETCEHPKRASYRRDGEGGNNDELIPSDCQESRCRGGRCSLWSVDDGKVCGDRQNNSCANDTCIDGQCVPKETNCSSLIAPSVCFDVTCNPTSGQCELELNGVVDCTCISDCSSCTQVNRLVNELAANVSETNLTTENGACWWCPTDGPQGPGCYNRINFETGEVIYYLDENNEPTEMPSPSCFKDEGSCAGGGDLSGGEIAGIVVAAVVVSAVAAAALGAAILLARLLRQGSATGEDAVLAAAAFDSSANENPFHESMWTPTNMHGAVQADSVPSAHFITH